MAMKVVKGRLLFHLIPSLQKERGGKGEEGTGGRGEGGGEKIRKTWLIVLLQLQR